MGFNTYDPKEVERKWSKRWEESKLHRTDDDPSKPKFYCLDMFPYPSGDGLHVGHWRGYVLSDVWSRYKRLQGFNVLHPMGWDAFGLPAENDAVKKGIHPKVSTQKNISNFKQQLIEMGAMYDWEREINTSDPEFYKYTQWIFLQMYKRGLAHRKEMPINWCPNCKTGLANEEVINGRCERCETEITRKPMMQWMLKITQYADRLLEDLDTLDWPDKVKKMQANWIGRSEGAEIAFPLTDAEGCIKIFTTRADTLFGVTYIVIAPEHALVDILTKPEHKSEIDRYIMESMSKSNIERMTQATGKTGVFTGSYVRNPINGEFVPVWISDYVLMDYGTGAVMAVPAHDSRDYEFAAAYSLSVKQVIADNQRYDGKIQDEAYAAHGSFTGAGILINSGKYTGMDSEQAREAIINDLQEAGFAERKVNYKLRDWVFSRQRYWGEPIPIILCSDCGEVPVPEEELPVLLPHVEKYEPSGTGESPLILFEEWVNTICPKCGNPARRETNTMPQWAGSSWYFLRYCDPRNTMEPYDKQKVRYWLPVDLYIGGNEHAILHLLYARFFTKFLNDIGSIDFIEPFTHLFNIGMINKDGYKMSKSKPNCVSSDEIVGKYGADTLRLYEMFIGPPEQESDWNDSGIEGVFRFLCKVWKMAMYSIAGNPMPVSEVVSETHKLIKGVTERIENQKLNTAVSLFMSYVNFVSREHPEGLDIESLSSFITLLAPFVPHFAEEIWEAMGNAESIFRTGRWPQFDPGITEEPVIEIPVQINGRVRDVIRITKGTPENEVLKKAKSSEIISGYISGRYIYKEIYIPYKVINLCCR
jgi:leucyl-tRNA synthetase